MALKPFNSVGGFSVGETPSNVILANGDVSTTKINSGTSDLTLTANGNVSTFYANGHISVPGTLTATGNITAPFFLGNVIGNISGNITVTGSNTNVLFNDDGNVGASANFTFNKSTNVLTVTGNATVSNLNTSGKVVASTLESNVATGTAPFVVASTTKVANLNVDTVDGFDTSQTATANTIAVRNADGNLAANFFIGNGSQLTGIGSAFAISNGTSNVSIPTVNGNVNTSVGGVANVLVVTTTGANVAGTLNATGNANVGNLGTAGLITATGNVTGGNLNTGGVLSVTGNANVGNLGTAGLITATGNITGGNLIGTLAGGNSNITITSNANISLFVAGNATARLVATTTGVNVAGTLNATGNANVGNIGATNANLTALTATGNANVGNLGTGGLIVATGNITGGNLNTGGVLSVTGNANVGNIGATNANLSAMTVTGNANVGNIGAAAGVFTGAISGSTTLNITGNANVGNLGTAGLIVATGNVTGGNLNTGGIVSATGNVSGGNLTTSGVLTVTGTGVSSIAGNLDMTSNNIINLATPVNPSDAATKQYVDDVAQGLHTHDTCNAATENTLAILSGGTVTYNNGSSGVGATLTTTGSYTTIDGVTLTNGMRILVKNEANSAHNGIYDRTSSTVLTRSSDFDTPTEMAGGDFTFVTAGTLYDNTGWVMTDPVTTVGTSPVPWVQFSGAGTYTAGTGLTLTGTVFSVNVAQPTITSVGNLTSLQVNGNANAGNLSTSGVLSVTGNANVGNIGATNANVTAITATGNANVGNLGTGGLIVATGNITGGNLVTSGLLSVTGNGNLGNVGATRGVFTNIVGTLETAAQPNITSVGTLSSLSVTGNVTAGNLLGILANGNSNVSIPAANGNVNISSAGNANIVVVTGTGANINGYANITGNVSAGNLNGGNLVVANFLQGTLTTAAQPNITSVGSLTSLTVSGNANVGNLGTAGLIVATGNVTGGNLNTGGVLSVTGNANTGNIGAATGAFTTAVIVNGANGRVFANGITASGAMSGNANSSTLTGNLGLRALASTYTDNVAAAGTVANTAIHGIGTPTFAASNAITATNAATFFIQGAPVASTNVTITNGYALHVGSGNSLFAATVVAGNLSTGGTLSVTGNANVGNLGTAGLVVATGNVTGGNLNTGGVLSVTGNANVGNLGTAGLIVATGNVTGGNLNTGGVLSVTGNANVGNLGTAGLITATGNITGGNLIGTLANGTSNVRIPTASGNVNISVNNTANVLVVTATGVNVAGTLNATGNANVGNIGATNANLSAMTVTGNANVGNIGATIGVFSNRLDIGNTDIGWATLTTTAVTANQTIATFAVSGVTGVEYLIKGVDATGSKYSVATISAVTDGTTVDYATYATAGLGTTTGTLAVNISSGNIVLQVTPASTNSTVWTTQYRVV